MKKTLFSIILIALATTFTASTVSANIILSHSEVEFAGGENTANLLNKLEVLLTGSDNDTFVNLLRLDGIASPAASSPFTVTYKALTNPPKGSNANNGASVSWDLTATGFNLLGIYVFGGSRGANIYTVNDIPQLLVGGPHDVHTPVTGGSGKFATISHILFFGEEATPVPDSGTTLALLGIALLALLGFRSRKA
ncbi:hypothetical protein VDG1235_2343 [Verrucomicrobiia bacterium DG1235]|nr:hypothetical protein VDG1235_2343 [Verrucomicrobiae bacterium DG1235]